MVTLVQILSLWTLSIVPSLSKNTVLFILKTQRFGDWFLSPSLSKTYLIGPYLRRRRQNPVSETLCFAI
jgi:hypothetical protein